MEIRVVSPDDWELWRDVRLLALRDAPSAFDSRFEHWVDAGEDRWRQRLEDVPCNVVAVVGDAPVGQASGMKVDQDQRVELISVWVAPGARGSGAADALVDAVCEFAAGCEAIGLRLSVKRDSHRAIRFYRRAGFLPDGRPPDGPDEMSMVCALIR